MKDVVCQAGGRPLERPVTRIAACAVLRNPAAILHPRMGKPIRAGIGGGKAVIPSNAKVCAAGSTIDVPIGHKDDSWSFDEIDTIGVAVPGSPLPDEVVVVLVFSDGGRPRCIP